MKSEYRLIKVASVLALLALAARGLGAQGVSMEKSREPRGAVVWVEAERFDDTGGWSNDAQFIDQMGSPYLLAAGMGTPVKDAATSVRLPRAGRYRLWARTRDWVPEHHPGRFQVLLNAEPAGPPCGASGKPGWRWEDLGAHDLSGTVRLALRDLTGTYGRCDALVLAADLEWSPPEKKDAIADLRERFGGVSREVKDAGRYDVVVVGGGLAGCTAAVSAARLGARTALIQDRPVLGGNGSTEILVPPVGVWPHSKGNPLDPRETGLVEEFRTEGNQRTVEARYYSERLQRLVAAEPGLDLFLNTHAVGVEMGDGRPGTGDRPGAEAPAPISGPPSPVIRSVLATDTRTGQRLRFAGRAFIDCTGDASVGVAAGAEYRQGREPRSMYNESLAPEEGDATTMGNSLKYVSQPTGTPQPFETPAWAMRFPTCESFPAKRHPPRLGDDIEWQWMLELGGTRDTYADKEEIRDDLLRLIYGIWGHLKNDCARFRPEAIDHKLVWVGWVVGVRESRRLLGDYVFTQNDVEQQTLHPDRVAYGSWGLDDHPSEGFFNAPGPSNHPFKGRLHSIPFRSLYSRNIGNLLMAGRDISASHIGMGTTRVMLTCAVMGQAAGTGAALCVRHGTTPRGVYEHHLDELQQQLLKDGAYIIDLPNRDPRDLALQASVSASGEATLKDGERQAAANVTDGLARLDEEGRTSAWSPDPTAAGPHWVELAWPEAKAFNVVHVTFQTRELAPDRFRVQAWVRGDWRTLADVTGNRLRRCVLGLERVSAPKLRVLLPEPAGICEVRVYDEPAAVVESARRVMKLAAEPDRDARLPWEPSLEASAFPGIVLDDRRARFTGEWKPGIGLGIDGAYVHDGNEAKGEKSARFEVKVPRDGDYEVRLAYTPLKNRATNVPVTIEHAGGLTTVQVDQTLSPPIDGRFVSLGTYHLTARRGVVVTVSNAGTDGYVIVDAVQVLAPVTRGGLIP